MPRGSHPTLLESILNGGVPPDEQHSARPGESSESRRDRELIELLNEMRVALPGVQVLFAFLLAAPFATGWKDVDRLQAGVYLASVLCAALATAFLIAPTTFHRLTFRMGFKEPLIRLGSVCLLLGTLMMACSMSLAVFVVTSVVIDDVWALVASLAVAAVLIGLWYVVPLLLRARDQG